MTTSTEHLQFIDDEASRICELWQKNAVDGNRRLFESVAYSFTKGGKRFRPTLCLMISDLYAVGPKRVLPWAMAIEMIHTYSLIHDDLPSMDNDDIRRGAPTNHKVFGEPVALLAGDGLLTEAFRHLSESYRHESDLGLRLVQNLSESAGLFGMVGGQMIDIQFSQLKFASSQEALQILDQLHLMKTGALIRAAAEGSAIVCGLSENVIKKWRHFGETLGLAFQIKDDLLDSQEKIESQSYPGLLGIPETEKRMLELSESLKSILVDLNFKDSPLEQMVDFNLKRTQ